MNACMHAIEQDVSIYKTPAHLGRMLLRFTSPIRATEYGMYPWRALRCRVTLPYRVGNLILDPYEMKSDVRIRLA